LKLGGGDNSERRRLALIAVLVVGGFIAFRQFGPDIDIEQILEDLSSTLGKATYALVGALAFLETGAFIGLIFPGETAVILGGAVAGQGETSLVLTIAIVWFCAWAGDTVSFVIGSRLGREFVLRHGPKVRITHERFAQVESYFARHGGKTILVGRFIGLVRALAPFVAGSSGMAYRAFVPFSVLGTGLWAATFTLLGYVISENLGRAADLAGKGTLVFGALIAVIVGIVLAVRFLRVAENRKRLVSRMEGNRALAALVELGRRVEPQARFLWDRITPGGLGLELTSLLAALAVAVFVLVGYATVVWGDPGPTTADAEALALARELRTDWLVDLARAVTVLGSAPATIAVGVVAGAMFATRSRWPEFWVLLAALALTHAAVPALKEIIDRPRPPDASIDVSGSSFPSGHAAYSVIYAWLALTIALRLRPGMANASALIVAGIALAAAVGLTRIELEVHYLSDVSAGWGLGVSAFALCAIVALVVTHLRQNAASG